MQTEQMPDTAPMQSAGQELVTRAEAMKITSPEDAQRAGAMLVDVKSLQKKIEKEFAEPKANAFATHKSITAMEKRMLELPTKAEGILKGRIGAWQMAEAKKAREEEMRLQKEAQARAEENRRHEVAEARKQAEEARRVAEEARLAEAVLLEEQGHAEHAEALLAVPVPEPVYVPPPPPIVAPVVRIAPTPIKGVSVVMLRDFRITDPLKVKREFLMVDEQKIRQVVKSLGKDAESLVGGIEFFETPSPRVGGR